MSGFAAIFTVLLVLAVAWGVGRDWCQRIADHRDRTSDEADHHRNYMREIQRHTDQEPRYRR